MPKKTFRVSRVRVDAKNCLIRKSLIKRIEGAIKIATIEMFYLCFDLTQSIVTKNRRTGDAQAQVQVEQNHIFFLFCFRNQFIIHSAFRVLMSLV